ncbi:hypothetical protein [Faecalibacterium prausnitzii]|uniref:hypothetical protein n=1 Tax=Faecalibacterium prausnitzii TaxID=853 RepID=UPI0016525117|nr:hypothetical protein [Faecalibacterium prausnitzii]
MTKRKNLPRATSARTSSKKKPALRSGPRGARKPFDQKKEHKSAPSARKESNYFTIIQEV